MSSKNTNLEELIKEIEKATPEWLVDKLMGYISLKHTYEETCHRIGTTRSITDDDAKKAVSDISWYRKEVAVITDAIPLLKEAILKHTKQIFSQNPVAL